MFLLFMVLGGCSRKFSADLPGFFALHSGDILWASMIYLGVRILFMNKSIVFAAVVSLLFCYLMEYSQLYQAFWINQIRQTQLGALILGHGFLYFKQDKIVN